MRPLTHKVVDWSLKEGEEGCPGYQKDYSTYDTASFATTPPDKGFDLETVQELLGHSHIRTTEKYLHTSDEKKMDAIARLQFALQGEPPQIRRRHKEKMRNLTTDLVFFDKQIY